FLLNISQSRFTPYGTVYIGLKHRPVIASLISTVGGIFECSPPRTALVLHRANPNSLVLLMKEGVNQYRDDAVQIEQRTVSLSAETKPVKMVVQRVRSYKYRQVAALVSLYKRFGLAFCEAAEVVADGQPVSIVLPPVFEEWGDDLIAIEGNTRLLYLY